MVTADGIFFALQSPCVKSRRKTRREGRSPASTRRTKARRQSIALVAACRATSFHSHSATMRVWLEKHDRDISELAGTHHETERIASAQALSDGVSRLPLCIQCSCLCVSSLRQGSRILGMAHVCTDDHQRCNIFSWFVFRRSLTTGGLI